MSPVQLNHINNDIQKKDGWKYLNALRTAWGIIKKAYDENYETSDEAYLLLKRIVRLCEKLIKAHEQRREQRAREREKALNR